MAALVSEYFVVACELVAPEACDNTAVANNGKRQDRIVKHKTPQLPRLVLGSE